MSALPQVVVRFSVIRLDRKGLAVTGFGFREPALLPEDVAQVVVRFSVVRLDDKGLAVTGFGLREPVLLLEGVCPGCYALQSSPA